MEIKTCEQYVLSLLDSTSKICDLQKGSLIEKEEIIRQLKLKIDHLEKILQESETHYNNLLNELVKSFKVEEGYSTLSLYFWEEPKNTELNKLYNDLFTYKNNKEDTND